MKICLILFALVLFVPLRAHSAGGKLNVVTTVAPITNIAKNIGGSKITLRGLVPEGVNSHTFEPKPSDVRLLARADLVILNGLNLEIPTEKMARASGKRRDSLLKLGDGTVSRREWIFDFSFPKAEGNPNPHLWMNIPYAIRYAELIRDRLSAMDGANRDFYTQNAEVYIARLKQLDSRIETAILTIPQANRKLLTYHDSWAYFARRYGMKVIGAIQPSSFSEPSAREVARIIDQLRREKVPAIFGSEVFPSKVLRQIAEEAEVAYIDTLRDDDLPADAGSPRHSFIGMMLEDVRVMVSALGGSAEALLGIDPADSPI
ncbi:MAG: metal ABC transporter substrate-binding protein [Deltaproteobacteria bacterium]